MTADTRDPAAAERYEHAVRMALEAWDATSGEVIETSRGQHGRRLARDHYEVRVRERLAQTAQVYEAAIDEAWQDGTQWIGTRTEPAMTDAKHPPRLTEQQRADRAECAALLRAALPHWGKRHAARTAAMIVDDPDEAATWALMFATDRRLAARALYDFCVARCRHDNE